MSAFGGKADMTLIGLYVPRRHIRLPKKHKIWQHPWSGGQCLIYPTCDTF